MTCVSESQGSETLSQLQTYEARRFEAAANMCSHVIQAPEPYGVKTARCDMQLDSIQGVEFLLSISFRATRKNA
jgi:hypothetical protein